MPVLEIRQTLHPCSAAGPLTSCECPVRVLPARRRTHRTGSGGGGLFLPLPRVLAQPERADWNAMDPQGCRHEGGNRKPKAREGGCLRSPVPGKRTADKDSTGGRFCATFCGKKVAKETHKQGEDNVKRRSLCRTISSISAWHVDQRRQPAASGVRNFSLIFFHVTTRTVAEKAGAARRVLTPSRCGAHNAKFISPAQGQVL
ncbi:hypothetical protein Selin_1021 [Desulfurispirillum indicum S5]|uniref:Uncharacterized protein n=1 Tax=Desulfurispirillum indicum (strain ATCC BAA-1389 / DSM 22839 / S5) TaxID=653733 RepID=E6W3G3_DESIS|nr:hypothetical protein Selin_1021 [Desulfurispirillum indicum S5]